MPYGFYQTAKSRRNRVGLGYIHNLTSYFYVLVGYPGDGDMIWSMTGRYDERIARDGLHAYSFRTSLLGLLRAYIDTNTVSLFYWCLKHN